MHHHGRGHLTRALAICAHLDEPVVFFSSLPRPAGAGPTHLWVQLPMDVAADGETNGDVTAGGRLHWAPTGVDGLTRRSALMLQVLAERRPRLMVVDVSVEVTVLARVAGVPVVAMAQPGDRTDAPHRLGFDLSDAIIATWSDEVYRPSWLTDHAARTHMVGAISRYDGARRPAAAARKPVGLLLAGAGGSAVPSDGLDQLRCALPDYEWTAAGGSAAWVDDVWPMLATADLVVTHAGQNALADTAAAGVAAVVIPQERPFGEQRDMADAVGRAGIAAVASSWPDPAEWPDLARQARDIDTRRWDLLGVRGSAARAAEVLAGPTAHARSTTDDAHAGATA